MEESKTEASEDPITSAETRAALMLLGRRAAALTQPKQKLTVAFLRRKVLYANTTTTTAVSSEADDQQFLSSTSIRLDSCNIHTIENLEMLDKLQHVHLQNNYIQTIEELDFVRNLTWLNLSRNNIQVIQGLSHLKALTCLDLSANAIVDVDDLSSRLPALSLRVLHLYGNPVATTNPEYRSIVTSSLPNLVCFDGTCLCDRPEDAPGFSPNDELFGCDGNNCRERVIFGPRFVTGVGKNEQEERDYCIACAYTAVVNHSRSSTQESRSTGKVDEGEEEKSSIQLEGHGFVLSTDASATFNPSIATVQGDKEDPTSILRRSAVEARVELRNQRESIMMKIRARRAKTSVAATKRLETNGQQMDLLKRLDDHIERQNKIKESKLSVQEVKDEVESKTDGGAAAAENRKRMF